MTISHPYPTTRALAAFAGLLIATAGTAAAGASEKFEKADADASGTLSIEEFRSTLSKKARPFQVKKKFEKADADGSGDVTLEEFIAYKNDDDDDGPDDGVTRRFKAADADEDGFLTYEEFTTIFRGKKPAIQVRKRFLRADADGDDLVSLDEWLAFKNDDGPDDDDKPLRKFDLADLDGNDELTLEEFATVFPAKKPARVIRRKFQREDENDDEVLTRDEWNPGTGKGKKKKP